MDRHRTFNPNILSSTLRRSTKLQSIDREADGSGLLIHRVETLRRFESFILCQTNGLWWNWYTHQFQKLAPKGLRDRDPPNRPNNGQLAEWIKSTSLENQQSETAREFESHTARQIILGDDQVRQRYFVRVLRSIFWSKTIGVKVLTGNLEIIDNWRRGNATGFDPVMTRFDTLIVCQL